MVWSLLGVGALILGLRLVQARPLSPALEASSYWPRELAPALEASRAQRKALHLHFSRPDVPAAGAMDETLALPPVRALRAAHFVSAQLDSRSTQELFRSLVGSAGALASVIVDVNEAGQPDVVAVATGQVDPERYCELLDRAAKNLPRLRSLRDEGSKQSSALLALGQLYAQQGSVARAREVFTSVTEPQALAAALEHLARLDVDRGHTARARAQLERARRLEPASRSLRWPLTEALVLSGERRVSEAVALLSPRLPAEGAGTERAASERSKARSTNHKLPSPAMILQAGTNRPQRNHRRRRAHASAGKHTSTIASCASSMPTLKAKSAGTAP
jgi:hypothetical protein